MSIAYSTEIAENGASNGQLERQYTMPTRGTETARVFDELLTTDVACQARAESVFLNSAYLHTTIKNDTYHIDGVKIGDTIDIEGINYKILAIIETIENSKVSMSIEAKRWD